MAEPELMGHGQQPGIAMDEENAQYFAQQAEHQDGNNAEHPDDHPKKRRRTAKPNADKKFECKHEGCGKSYSRAEHLYRHQLNHTPKNIYHCDFPDCNRYFVRQDLCVRHRERHTTAGSQLHKRDTFAQASQNAGTAPKAANISPAGHYDNASSAKQSAATDTNMTDPDVQNSYVANESAVEVSDSLDQSSKFGRLNMSPNQNTGDSRFVTASASTKPMYEPHRSNSFGSHAPNAQQQASMWPPRRDSMNHASARALPVQPTSQSMPQSPVRTYSNSSTTPHPVASYRNNPDMYSAPSQRTNLYYGNPDLHSLNYNTSLPSSDMTRHNQEAFNVAVSQGLSSSTTDPYLYSNLNGTHQTIDNTTMYSYPVFGNEDYSRSPFVMNDDFTAWLFNPNVAEQTNKLSPDMFSGLFVDGASQNSDPIISQSPTNNIQAPGQASMHVSRVLDGSVPSSYIMSEEKRQELLDIMQIQFVERTHDAVKKRKDMVFEGDVNADDHILSLRMMHTYLGSYWYHQHAQLPILHKPTFSADKTPTLLLLAVVAIGAATLDKAYGTALTDSAAEFANFIIWHLRWEIMRDIDFRPPAKLWVFQTMLLIEVYEKMYSTRTLHERAHIHHDSTLTLMRRGSSFIGRSASESPFNGLDDRSGKAANGRPADRSEADWHRWISTETTRRAAFGAFVLDAIHCTMFGHAAKMVAHELRLPLPCDEALWSATSPAEVGRVQASLRTNGIKPIFFLDGLKRTLNGQPVRTNSFGRTIIMAGLLSVSYTMTQRDLQIASIGPRAANSIGGPDKWKGTLLRAFDNWKRDFDEALAESAISSSLSAAHRTDLSSSSGSVHRPVDEENIFESRTVLHHLAHIAAHVDIIDCQVFAGASRLLSRRVTPQDYGVIKDKMEKWAARASARDSAFYALKFITTVLIPPGANDGDGIDSRIYGHASPILPQAYESDRYIARDDFLLNRPWVLYISALVVWCYGFALEGAIRPAPRDADFATYEQKETDMRDFLDRVAGVRAPDDLEHVTGKNRCLGLLLLLQDSFHSTRWELMHEAASLLGNAATKLKNAQADVQTNHMKKTNGIYDIPTEFRPAVSAFNTARP